MNNLFPYLLFLHFNSFFFIFSFFRKPCLTDCSAMETTSVSSVSSAPDFSHPSLSPPVAPNINRAGLSEKPRHRLPVQIPQLAETSFTPLYKNQNLKSSTPTHDNTEEQPMKPQSSFISSVNEQRSFGCSRNLKTEIGRFIDEHKSGHETSTEALLIPAPPSGQRTGRRGPRAGRRLTHQQTGNSASVQSVEN